MPNENSVIIEISADYSKFKSELNEVTKIAESSGGEVEAAWESSAQKISELTIQLDLVAESLDDVSTKTYDFYKAFYESSEELDKVVNSTLSANKEFRDLDEQYQKISKSIEEYRIALDKSFIATENLSDQINQLKNNQQKLDQLYKSGSIAEDYYKSLSDEISKTSQSLKDYQKELNSSTKEYEKNTEKISKLTAESDLLAESLDRIANETKYIHQDFYKSSEALDKVVNSALSANKEFINLDAQYQKINNSIDQYANKNTEISESLLYYSRKAQESADKTKILSEQTESLSKEGEEASEQTKILSKNIEEAAQNAKQQSEGIDILTVAFGNLVAKGISLAINALKEFITQGIEYQTSLEASSAIIDEVFGESGSYKIKKWSNTVAESLGWASGNAQNFAANIGLILSETKYTGAALADMSAEIIEAGTNWAYFTNNSPEDVLSAIESALSGNTRALRNYGIILDSTSSNLSSHERILSVYNQVLEKTSKYSGDAEQSQQSYSASVFKLKQNISALSGELARQFLPSLTEVIEKTNEYLSKNRDALENLGKVLGTILSLAVDLITLLSKLPPDFLIFVAVILTVITAVTKLGNIFKAFGTVLSTTTGQIVALIAVLAILLFLILSIKEGSDKASQSLSSLGSTADQATNDANSSINKAKNSNKYATGTNYAQEGWALVGESGPEFIRLTGGEQILNATRTANAVRDTYDISNYRNLNSNDGAISSREEYTYNDNRKQTVRGLQELNKVAEWFDTRRMHNRKV